MGKHNDTVMAFAHAIDQFSVKEASMPVMMGTAKGGEWLGGVSKRRLNRGMGGVGGVINRG